MYQAPLGEQAMLWMKRPEDLIVDAEYDEVRLAGKCNHGSRFRDVLTIEEECQDNWDTHSFLSEPKPLGFKSCADEVLKSSKFNNCKDHPALMTHCARSCGQCQVANRQKPIIGYMVYPGHITNGDDLTSEYMTLDEAAELCNQMQQCEGFTFDSSDAHDPPFIRLKRKWDVDGQGGAWRSYQKADRVIHDFREFDGFISAGLEVSADFMTPDQASVLCVEMPACEGFTYNTEDPNNPPFVRLKGKWDVSQPVGTTWKAFKKEIGARPQHVNVTDTELQQIW